MAARARDMPPVGMNGNFGKTLRELQAAMAESSCKILLAGPPGCGKRTAVLEAARFRGIEIREVDITSKACVDGISKHASATLCTGGEAMHASVFPMVLVHGLECIEFKARNTALQTIFKKLPNCIVSVNNATGLHVKEPAFQIWANGFSWDDLGELLRTVDPTRCLTFKDKERLRKSEDKCHGDARRVLLGAQSLITARQNGLSLSGMQVVAESATHNYKHAQRFVLNDRAKALQEQHIMECKPWIRSNMAGNLSLDDAAAFAENMCGSDASLGHLFGYQNSAEIDMGISIEAGMMKSMSNTYKRTGDMSWRQKLENPKSLEPSPIREPKEHPWEFGHGHVHDVLAKQVHQLRSTHRQHNKLMHAIHGNGVCSDALSHEEVQYLIELAARFTTAQLKQFRDDCKINAAASTFSRKPSAIKCLVREKPDYIINCLLADGGMDIDEASPLQSKIQAWQQKHAAAQPSLPVAAAVPAGNPSAADSSFSLTPASGPTPSSVPTAAPPAAQAMTSLLPASGPAASSVPASAPSAAQAMTSTTQASGPAPSSVPAAAPSAAHATTSLTPASGSASSSVPATAPSAAHATTSLTPASGSTSSSIGAAASTGASSSGDVMAAVQELGADMQPAAKMKLLVVVGHCSIGKTSILKEATRDQRYVQEQCPFAMVRFKGFFVIGNLDAGADILSETFFNAIPGLECSVVMQGSRFLGQGFFDMCATKMDTLFVVLEGGADIARGQATSEDIAVVEEELNRLATMLPQLENYAGQQLKSSKKLPFGIAKVNASLPLQSVAAEVRQHICTWIGLDWPELEDLSNSGSISSAASSVERPLTSAHAQQPMTKMKLVVLLGFHHLGYTTLVKDILCDQEYEPVDAPFAMVRCKEFSVMGNLEVGADILAPNFFKEIPKLGCNVIMEGSRFLCNGKQFADFCATDMDATIITRHTKQSADWLREQGHLDEEHCKIFEWRFLAREGRENYPKLSIQDLDLCLVEQVTDKVRGIISATLGLDWPSLAEAGRLVATGVQQQGHVAITGSVSPYWETEAGAKLRSILEGNKDIFEGSAAPSTPDKAKRVLNEITNLPEPDAKVRVTQELRAFCQASGADADLKRAAEHALALLQAESIMPPSQIQLMPPADPYQRLDAALANYKVHPDYGVYLVPANNRPECLAFLNDFTDSELQNEICNVPVVHKGEEIKEGVPQWVHGHHSALGGFMQMPYNTLFAQVPPLAEGIVPNIYNGVGNALLLSTCHISALPRMDRMTHGFCCFMSSAGLEEPTHLLGRDYIDGDKGMGFHSDTDQDFHEYSCICLIRVGPGARRFQFRSKDTQQLIFDKVIQPLDVVIFTLLANRELEHCVPKDASATERSTGLSLRAIKLRMKLPNPTGNTVKDVAKARKLACASRGAVDEMSDASMPAADSDTPPVPSRSGSAGAVDEGPAVQAPAATLALGGQPTATDAAEEATHEGEADVEAARPTKALLELPNLVGKSILVSSDVIQQLGDCLDRSITATSSMDSEVPAYFFNNKLDFDSQLAVLRARLPAAQQQAISKHYPNEAAQPVPVPQAAPAKGSPCTIHNPPPASTSVNVATPKTTSSTLVQKRLQPAPIIPCNSGKLDAEVPCQNRKLGTALVAVLDQPVARQSGDVEFEHTLQSFQDPADNLMLSKRDIVLHFIGGPGDVKMDVLCEHLQTVCKPMGVFFDAARFEDGDIAILTWRPSAKGPGQYQNVHKAIGKKMDGLVSPDSTWYAKVLKQAGSNGKGGGGKGRNDGMKLEALKDFGNLAGEGFHTMDADDDTQRRSYTFEEMQRFVLDWTLSDFTAKYANAKQVEADSGKEALFAFDRSLSVQHAEIKDYIKARVRAKGMVLPVDGEKHFDIFKPGKDCGDFKDWVMDMIGTLWDVPNDKIYFLTFRQVMTSPLLKERAIFIIGDSRYGKSELQHAIGRDLCRRSFQDGVIQSGFYFYGSENDPAGVLTQDGTFNGCSSFHWKDPSFSTLMNSKLTEREIKELLDVNEMASHRARYHPAAYEAEKPRTISINTGKNKDGSIDWGAELRHLGLDMLVPMAEVDPEKKASIDKAEKAIRAYSSHQKAFTNKAIIFKVTDYLYHGADAEKAKKDKQAIIQTELENAQQFWKAQPA